MTSKPGGRRRFLKKSAAMAGLALGAARSAAGQTPASQPPAADPPMKDMKDPKELAKELVAYGERSHFVKSVRVPVAERMSPDMYGLTFHVLTPLQDSVGIITPSSLHYVATHRGSFVPDVDPSQHRVKRVDGGEVAACVPGRELGRGKLPQIHARTIAAIGAAPGAH